MDLNFDNVNEGGQSEIVELTEFQTTTQLSRGTVQENLFRYKTLPFKDQTPVDILTRPYTVRTDTFSNSGLVYYNPLALWLAQPDVAKALDYFTYAKFKIVVRHQITAAFELYGYVLAGYYYGNKDDYDFTDLFTTDCYISSVSAVEPIEYEIAYNAISSYIPTRNPDFIDSYCRSFIRWDVEHSVGGTSEIQMKTIVSMEELEVGGFTGVRVQSGKKAMNPLAQTYADISKAAQYALPLATLASTYLSSPISSVPGASPDGVKSFSQMEPETAAGTSVAQSLYGDLAKPSYSKQKQQLDLIPPSRPGFTGGLDYRLSDLMILPGYYGSAEVDSERLVFSLKLGNMEEISKTWLFYVRNAFRFWVGSMKVVLWFFASPLVAARFKVSASYGYNTAQATAPPDDYSVPTKQFLVRGDHREELIIPYHAWVPCMENSGPGALYGLFELYCIQKPNDVSAGNQGKIQVHMTVSGCHDNVVYSTRHFFYPQTVPALQGAKKGDLTAGIKVQASLRSVHASQEGHSFGIGTPINYPDYMVPVVNLSEVIGRFDDRPASDSSFLNKILPLSVIGVEQVNPAVSNLDYFSYPFAFRRGSMDFKLGYTPLVGDQPYTFTNTLAPSINVIPSTTDERTANGQFISNTSVWSVADITIPYLSCYHQQGVVTEIATVDNIQPATDAPVSSLEKVLVRAGTDYQLSHPNILPLVQLTIPG